MSSSTRRPAAWRAPSSRREAICSSDAAPRHDTREGRAVIVMPVRQIMTRRVVTMRPETTLVEARRLLDEHRIRHLPVLVDGRLAGIVSDRDLRSAAGAHRPQTAVDEIMTPTPFTVGPDT